MSLELSVFVILWLASLTASIVGTLLLVGRRSMVCEGISHAMLPGIAIAFWFVGTQYSPWLWVSAAIGGVLMVVLTAGVANTRRVDPDAALGIVFSAMFSIGVLFIARALAGTSFHAECAIEGNATLAALDRVEFAGRDLGPRAMWSLLVALALVIGATIAAYKEMKLMLFDKLLARRFNYRPRLLEAIWMSAVSLVTVIAFEVAGAVLIVGLMIAPAAAASLCTDRLGRLFWVAAAIATVASITGMFLALRLDISPAGPTASSAGLLFVVAMIFAPNQGWIARSIRESRARRQIASDLVADTRRRLGLRSTASETKPLSAEESQRVAERLGWTIQQVRRATATRSRR
ncbi:MAG: metal ABC transporter permease [Planctomycetota bacterium]